MNRGSARGIYVRHKEASYKQVLGGWCGFFVMSYRKILVGIVARLKIIFREVA